VSNLGQQLKLLRFLPFLIFLFFIRPTGLITVIYFTFFVLYLVGKNKVKLYQVCAFTFIIGIITLLLANQMLDDYNIVEPLQNGEVICGVSQAPLSANVPKIRVEFQSKLLRFVFFIWVNPFYFLKISFYKAFYFWTTFRPGFSFLHNLVSLIFFLPIYFFALFACWKTKIPNAIKVYILTFITWTFILVIVTCVNWNSRFLAPALPFVFILAGLGMGNFISKMEMALQQYLQLSPSN